MYFCGKVFGTEEEKQSGRPQIREAKIQPDRFDNCQISVGHEVGAGCKVVSGRWKRFLPLQGAVRL